MVIFAVAAGAGFYFFNFRNINPAVKESGITLPGPDVVSGSADAEKEATLLPPIVQLEEAAPQNPPAYTGEPITRLNPDPKVVASVGVAYVERYQKDLTSIADRVEKGPQDYVDWLGVAYIKKLFNNYIGTRDAWEYAKVLNPDSPIAYFNLGELYGYEFKEPVKAEENYLSALRLNPYHLDYYIGLANFYEDVPKDLKKAESVLLSALDKIPHTESNLFAQIGSFYRDQKDYAEAIEYFEKALNAATDPGVKKAIQNEIDYIRSKQ